MKRNSLLYYVAGCMLLVVNLSSCKKNETPVGPVDSSYITDFEALWTHFDQEYCYFPYKNVDWNQLHSSYRPSMDTVSSTNSFLSICASLLAPLRDGHVYFIGPNGSYRSTYSRNYVQNWSASVYNGYFQRYNGKLLDPGLGYAIIDSFAFVKIEGWTTSVFSITDFDNILDSCRNMHGLILDVRPNGGGNQNLALEVAGRFTSIPRIGSFYRVRNGPAHTDLTPLTPIWYQPRVWTWTKPVTVLIGRTCFSSNEGFTSAMHAIPGVTLIGDTTGGGSGNPKFYTFSNGWQYSVPQWIEYTVDSTIIEWNGIAPDIYVQANASDFNQGIDPVFDFALQWIKGVANQESFTRIAAKR